MVTWWKKLIYVIFSLVFMFKMTDELHIKIHFVYKGVEIVSVRF